MSGQEEQAAELQRYLYALYHAPTTSSREQANDWLNSWQLSRAAWGLVHDILLGRVRGIVLLQCRLVVVLLHRRGMRHLGDAVTQSATRPLGHSAITPHVAIQPVVVAWQVQISPTPPSSEVEVYYFAAQTLRTKITRDFEELDAGMRATLPDSVLEMLGRHHSVSFIRTQLSLAMAMLGMHIPSLAWREVSGSGRLGEPGPSSMIEWVARRLYNEASMRQVLLEILTVVPQEAMAYHPSLLPERRREIEREMKVDGLSKALEVLEALMREQSGVDGGQSGGLSNDGIKHILEAFAAWLRFGGNAISPSLLAASSLIPLAINSLQKEEEAFYAAVDAVVEIIYCSSAHGRPKAELGGLVTVLVAQVMALLPQFHVCIQQAVDEASGKLVEENNFGEHGEQAKALARLFAEVGEAYADLICEASPEVMGPVEALLDVCRYPDMEVSSISFNFWHRVSFILSAGKKPHNLNWEGDVLPEAEAERRVGAFRGHFERLVMQLAEKAQYPEDSEHWHSDEKNDFKYTRQAVGDLLLDATDIIGPDSCMRLVIRPLSEVSERMNAGGSFEWRRAEGSLYCLRSIHRASNDVQDGALLLSILSSLSYLPSQPTLDYSVALMLGAYADWLAREAERDQSGNIVGLIQQLIELIVKGLGNDNTSAACALSLRNICDSCGRFLVAGSNGAVFMEQMLELYRQAQSHGDLSSASNGYNAVGSTILDEEDVENILEGITMVVKHLPPDSKRDKVHHMIDSVVQPIQMVLEKASSVVAVNGGLAGNAPSESLVVLPLFERVVTILRNVNDVDDVASTLEKLLPWLEMALTLFELDPEASERICRVPRYAVRTAKRHTIRSLPALSNMLMSRFERTKHSCYLYVASELVKAFGDPAEDIYTQPLLSRMLITSCAMLGSLQAVSAKPDLTDDTFLLAGRGLSYAPRLMMTQELLVALIETSRNAILVQHLEACSSVASFLVRLLDPSTHRHCDINQVKTLEAVFQPYAGILTQLTIAGGVGALPSSRVHEMADVLYALLKGTQNATESLHRVQAALALVPDSALPSNDKGRFLQLCGVIVSDQILEDDEQQLVQGLIDLSECCRRHSKVQAVVMDCLLEPQFRVFN